MYQNFDGGYIEVVCGPMFAGKTEELIRRIKRLEYAKIPYLVFKPKVDDRYGDNVIKSHNKNEKNAINIEHSKEILPHLKDVKVEVIIIDEAQFFDQDLAEVVDELADLGYRVIVGGLDRDFRGEPFGPMPSILARAEVVTKLTAICPVSGKPATRTQRIINGKPAAYDDPIVLIDAEESYEPRSRNKHQVNKKK
ncbi:MAG: thymidine kinase [Bacillota bacterium]|jgi:thymidine kinase|nr:thymidine kinase [Bacillota bacterium]